LKYEQKNKESKTSPLSIVEYNKEVNRCKLGLKIIKKIVDEYSANKPFYDDFVRFNCQNRTSVEIPSEIVTFGNPPSTALKAIDEAYARLKGLSNDQIFKALGVQKNSLNRCSPVEYKWFLLYLKKYGKKWDKANAISCDELLA
jgi:hypothetical protein